MPKLTDLIHAAQDAEAKLNRNIDEGLTLSESLTRAEETLIEALRSGALRGKAVIASNPDMMTHSVWLWTRYGLKRIPAVYAFETEAPAPEAKPEPAASGNGQACKPGCPCNGTVAEFAEFVIGGASVLNGNAR